MDYLALKNIRLVSADFQQIDESYGKFDYIICHGVFSWIPVVAQNRVLEICRDLLTQNGVAYISYNAYPGWFMRGMIRQMMLHHVSHIASPPAKIKQARALLNFIVESTQGQPTPYAEILKAEIDLLARHPDSYLFHEHLEENNRPLFFYQFMEMTTAHDLQFLGESNLANMITSNLPTRAAEALIELTADVHQRSQYTDFVTNRMFRQSLLCLKDRGLNRELDPQRIVDGYFSANIQLANPSQADEFNPEVEVAFECANGRKIQTKNSALKALVFSLRDAWPRSLSLSELAQFIEQKLTKLELMGERDSASIARLVRVNTLQMLVRGEIQVRFAQDRFCTEISKQPLGSPLARFQARTDSSVTNGRHCTINLDPIIRIVLQLCDGTRTIDDLIAEIRLQVNEGMLFLTANGPGLTESDSLAQATVHQILLHLKRNAVLVA